SVSRQDQVFRTAVYTYIVELEQKLFAEHIAQAEGAHCCALWNDISRNGLFLLRAGDSEASLQVGFGFALGQKHKSDSASNLTLTAIADPRLDWRFHIRQRTRHFP
ncbi:hypothetical protein PspLS_08794, partial [Pyricularia sp. CBS 133598]